MDKKFSEHLSSALTSITDKVGGWVEAGIAMLPNYLVALLIVLVFVLLAKLARRLTRRILTRISDNVPVQHLLSAVVYYGAIVTGLFIALGVLQLQKTVTSLLAGVGIIGLALGFAFQDIAANFVSGVLLAFHRPFGVGDIIETKGISGMVQRIELRSTLIKEFDGRLVYVPNKEVFSNPIINIYGSGSRRIEVPVGVTYGADLDKVKRVAIAAIEGVTLRDADKPTELHYKGFGDSSINFEVRFWVDFNGSHTDFQEARSQAVMCVKKAFDENDITIPFPIRTLDLGDNVAAFKEAFARRGAEK